MEIISDCVSVSPRVVCANSCGGGKLSEMENISDDVSVTPRTEGSDSYGGGKLLEMEIISDGVSVYLGGGRSHGSRTITS